jgi:hypothetical protein
MGGGNSSHSFISHGHAHFSGLLGMPPLAFLLLHTLAVEERAKLAPAACQLVSA